MGVHLASAGEAGQCIVGMTPTARAVQLLNTPTELIPELARTFRDYFASRYGHCTENMAICFAVYAQIIEGLECTDARCMATDNDREWFHTHTATP